MPVPERMKTLALEMDGASMREAVRVLEEHLSIANQRMQTTAADFSRQKTEMHTKYMRDLASYLDEVRSLKQKLAKSQQAEEEVCSCLDLLQVCSPVAVSNSFMNGSGAIGSKPIVDRQHYAIGAGKAEAARSTIRS